MIPVSMKWGQLPLLYLAPAGSLVLCFVFGFRRGSWGEVGVRTAWSAGGRRGDDHLSGADAAAAEWAYVLAHGSSWRVQRVGMARAQSGMTG